MITALARDESPAVIVKFHGKADLSAAFQISDRDARSIYVHETLTRFADAAQGQARQMLQSQFGLSETSRGYTVLWIDNSIAISNLTAPMLSSLESSANVELIRAQRNIPLPVEEVSFGGPELDAVVSSVARIKAPDVWALGYKGAGIVLANIDSGVRHTHAAVVNQYRGNLGGGSFDHLYNWYDPYNHATVPRTTHDHGSHTMGTMVGDNGGTEQIGVSPESKWINCIGFGEAGAGGTDAGLLECGQWMLAPTDFAGTPSSADPTKRPDVVNNSWGDCGQSYDTWYENVIDGWIAAGIAPVFSNGNASNCGYSSNPPLNTVGNPARSGKVLGIGSTGTNNGQYANHSNKGPTDNLNTGLPNYPDPLGFANLKPNFMAPGVNIRSALATSNTAYGTMTGTSMSAPAATGVIGLMWSAAPCLKGNYGRTGTILMQTAVRIPVSTGSPSDGPGNIPNQATGWGEVDALAAVNAGIAFCINGVPPSASKLFAPSQIMAGETSTLTISLDNSSQTTAAVLSAALTDTFPAGLLVAAAPNVSTTCTAGTVTAVAGGNSVALNSGASIPASGSCTVKVDVTAAADGSYANTIAAGALQTQHGNNSSPANATLKVGFTFPEPYCSVGFSNGVEPISRVLFSNISNPSSATIGGSPALENFTGIIGSVDPGATYSMAVEGNTSGNYTTKIKVYVDWNQNGVFTDPGESHVIGDLTNSTGADGKQAVANIVVPATAMAGQTRMRVTKRWSVAADPCNSAGYGQAEDYTLTVTGGAITHTVTPSVGTPSGTISPATAQTVNDGSTTSFTLAADAGFHVDNVGGTCGGSLAGNVFTTAAVTADCTVIANFAVDSGGSDLVCAAPNHDMVETFDGSSVNWITGVITDDDTQIHWNPFDVFDLAFYFSTAGGGGGVATSDVYEVLAPGAVIGAASTFSRETNTTATVDWRADVDGYMGFKLSCPGAGTCYGYAHLSATAPSGFPLTLKNYCYDKSGADITIPAGVITHTVTPSVGTGDGTITPAIAQTVNDSDTIAFTLAADAGFHIDTVGGTCSGTLAGNVYTTAPVTADCTVIANFAADSSSDLVCSAALNHTIQNSINGTYINWESGQIGDGASVPGANFNPYGSSGKIAFYWPNSAGGNAGAALTPTGKDWLVLQGGDQVGPSSVFSSATGVAANWEPGADGYVGFRFNCSTAGTCYGYAHMTSTGPQGHPATLVDYCYDKSGAAVTIAGGSTSPTLAKSFAPDTVAVNVTSVATIVLSNPSAVDAVLTAPLVDTMPAGLTATSASTSCLIG
ncbi:MAG: S8 family serine peptidase, partial [Dokdonella sp.]